MSENFTLMFGIGIIKKINKRGKHMNEIQKKSGEMHRQFKKLIISLVLDNEQDFRTVLYCYIAVICDKIQINIHNSSKKPERDIINAYAHFWARVHSALIHKGVPHQTLWLCDIFRHCFAIFFHGNFEKDTLLSLDDFLRDLSENTKPNEVLNKYVEMCMKRTKFDDAIDIVEDILLNNNISLAKDVDLSHYKN